jgi:hypothetical protein
VKLVSGALLGVVFRLSEFLDPAFTRLILSLVRDLKKRMIGRSVDRQGGKKLFC